MKSLVNTVKNHTMRAGTVLTVGSTRDESIMLAEKVSDNLKFEII